MAAGAPHRGAAGDGGGGSRTGALWLQRQREELETRCSARASAGGAGGGQNGSAGAAWLGKRCGAAVQVI